MADYTKHNKAELIALLETQERELHTRKETIVSLQTEATGLQEQLEVLQQQSTSTLGNVLSESDRALMGENPIENTAQTIILMLQTLTETDKKKLPLILRTTPEGIKAFQTIVYGAALQTGALPVEDVLIPPIQGDGLPYTDSDNLA